MKTKKLAGRYYALIIEAILFVLWNILVFTLADLKEANVFFWCGYGFTFLAFLLVAGVMFFLKADKNVIFSVLMPSYIVSGLYFVITFVMNAIYMGIATGTNAKAVVIPNVVVLFLYIAAMVVAYIAISHIGGNNRVIDEKVAKLKTTAIAVGQIAAIATDGEVKAALAALRESVEYSDPMGVPATASMEDDLNNKIVEIKVLVEGGYEKDMILSRIAAARNKLTERNEILRASK